MPVCRFRTVDGVVTDGEVSSLTYVTSIDASSSSSEDFISRCQEALDKRGMDRVMLTAGDGTVIDGDGASAASSCLIADAKVISRSAADHRQSDLDEHRSVEICPADAGVELNAVRCNDDDDDKNALMMSTSSSFSVTTWSSVAFDDATTEVPVHPVAVSSVSGVAEVPLHPVAVSSVSRVASSPSNPHRSCGFTSVAESDTFLARQSCPGSEPLATLEATAVSSAARGLSAPSQSSETANLFPRKHCSTAEASDDGPDMNLSQCVEQPEFGEPTFSSDSNREFCADREAVTYTADFCPSCSQSPVISAFSNADIKTDVSQGLVQTVLLTDGRSVNNNNAATAVPECCFTQLSDVRNGEKSVTNQPDVDDFASLHQVS